MISDVPHIPTGHVRHFRIVREKDIAEILNIYEPYVKNTAITFEVTLPSVDEFRTRVKSISADYPYLVCVSYGRIIGYAYARRHMEREAYQWNAELSVYIDKNYQGSLIGTTLYEMLIKLLKLQNVKNVYGGVTLPNEKSERLHEALGFSKLGTYHKAGYKCGAWHDVAWFEKKIGDYGPEPAPFISIQNIEARKQIRIQRCCFASEGAFAHEKH